METSRAIAIFGCQIWEVLRLLQGMNRCKNSLPLQQNKSAVRKESFLSPPGEMETSKPSNTRSAGVLAPTEMLILVSGVENGDLE